MEWSKDKTLKLVEVLQVNSALWNPSACESRRDKQKRKEELRAIANIMDISVADITKKIQHLRTQYNREASREARLRTDDPNERYISNWYAFEYLHFLKDSSKPFRLINPKEYQDELNGTIHTNQDISMAEVKLLCRSPPHKVARSDSLLTPKGELGYSATRVNRDEFSVFGEYVANELRSLKGEKNLLVAKKKIQDAIFEVKIGSIHDHGMQATVSPIETHHPPHQHHNQGMHNGKLFSPPVMSTAAHIEPHSHAAPPTTSIGEIIINSACHYPNFKVDNQ